MADFMKSQIDYIFFFYGLAFILLAPICQILRRRPQPQSPWVWLGAFGVLHGVNELIGLLSLSMGSNAVFDLARLVLATSSFLFLMEFGRAGTLTFRGRGPGRWILAVLLGVSLLGLFAGLAGFSVVSCYVLGFGGGLWATGTLYLASKAPGAGKRFLQSAALGMLGYALTNLVVTPAPFFPAAQLNAESFLAMTGLSIQLVKGVLAFWLSACLVLLADVSLPREAGRRIRVWNNILMLGGVVSVTALLVAGWFTTQYFGDDAFRDIRTKQESHSKILHRFLTDKMEEAAKLAYTMAGSPWIPPALEHRDTQTINQANSILDRYSLTVPGSVCYLMDLNGLTIASSNRHQPDSFVGKSYEFRPYFQQAVRGTPGGYWALGVTSKELGFYASYPVRDRAGKIVGVAVFKRLIGEAEDVFPANTLGFVIDSHGIVIMANRPEMVLQSLWPLSRETKEKLQASRQFGPGPFTPILNREPVDPAEARFQGTSQLALRQPLPWEDWSMVILSPMRPIMRARLTGIGITLFVSSGMIAFLTILGLGIDTTARIQSSESKYKFLFQNNPLGIFHFNETGTVTDCNEKFAEIIGAPKEKIIGFNLRRQLQNERIRETILTSMNGGCCFYEGDYLSVLGGKLTSVRAIFQGILSPDNEFLGGVGIFEDFTVRRQTLEALRESEEKFRLVFEKAPLGIMHYDQTSTIINCNEKYMEIIGAPKEKFIGFNMMRQLRDDKMRETVAASLKGEVGYYEGDYLSVTAGKTTPVRAIFQPIFSTDGALSGGVAIFEDISQRKRAEELLAKNHKELQDFAYRLEQSRNMLQLVIESIPVRVFWKDNDLRYMGCNTLFAHDAGFKNPQQLLGKDDFAMGWKEQADLYRTDDRRVMESRHPKMNIVEPQTSPAGDKIWLNTSKVPLIQPNGEVVGVLGVYEDITEHKQAEEAFQALVTHAPIGIYIVQQGKFAMINPGFEAITGYDAQEMIGQNCLSLVIPDKRAFVREQAILRLKQEGLPPYEYQYIAKSGETRWVMETVTSTQYKAKMAVLGYFMDITPLKELEAQFLQAQKMEAVGRLAGGIAHDFNNILGVIIGYTEIMLMGLKENDPLCGYLEEIKRAAVRAASLTRQLLVFSRKQIQQLEVINLNEVVTDLETMLHRLIGEDLELVMGLDSALPSVKADKGQVEQIILNLAINAKDAMPQGGKLTIETCDVYLDETYCRDHPYVSPGPFVMLSVSDNGMGMDEETRAHIFEPFFTTKEAGKGTGLGLSTVFGIVKQSGGSIEVYSEAGVGTTLKVYLPSVEKPAEKPQAEIYDSPLSDHETILLVEDDDGLRPLIIDVLKMYGYEILEARDGDEALRICKDHEGPIHLMLTDVVMPRMNGRQLADHMASMYPQMQILFMSGYTDNAVVHHGVLHEDTAYIQKPFAPDDLAKKVREVLATSFSK